MRAALLLAAGLVATGLGLAWLAGGSGVEPPRPSPRDLPGPTPTEARAAAELTPRAAAPSAREAPSLPLRTAIDSLDPEATRAERLELVLAACAEALADPVTSRARLDGDGAALAAALGPEGEQLLGEALADGERPPLARLAAANLLAVLEPRRSLTGPERELLWAFAGVEDADRVDGTPELQAWAAQRALCALGEQAAVLDHLERAVAEAAEAALTPAAQAWILGRGHGDTPIENLAARTDGALADGALATLARWCDDHEERELTTLTRASWRATLVRLADRPDADGAQHAERVRDAVDAFARLTGDPSLALPEPRSEATVRRLVARVWRRDAGLWEHARQELGRIASDPTLDADLRVLAQTAL